MGKRAAGREAKANVWQIFREKRHPLIGLNRDARKIVP